MDRISADESEESISDIESLSDAEGEVSALEEDLAAFTFVTDWDESDSRSSERSADSVSSSDSERSSAERVGHVLPGRWIDPKMIMGSSFASRKSFKKKASSFAEFVSLITRLSRDSPTNRSKRFTRENEYIRLNETVLSEFFALLVCLNLSPAEETSAINFFARRWSNTFYKLCANLNNEEFPRQTFESSDDITHEHHKSEEPGDLDRESQSAV